MRRGRRRAAPEEGERAVDGDDEALDPARAILWSLDNRVRLRMVAILAREELTVAALQERLGIAGRLASYHLQQLDRIGVVHRRRVGQHVAYAFDPAGWSAAIEVVRAVPGA